jgi:hypothetical protein
LAFGLRSILESALGEDKANFRYSVFLSVLRDIVGPARSAARIAVPMA